ncbi:conserved exported hypothetical protein [Paraburkholderia caribensis]|nr:conserved exported hypothetical protein [Paraburkholderia caribensis]
MNSNCIIDKGAEMRVYFASLLVASALSAVTGFAYAQTTWQQPSGSADPQMAPAASMSQPQMAQPASSMNRYEYDSVGPQPGGSSGSGRGRNGGPCVIGLSCDIYQGS